MDELTWVYGTAALMVATFLCQVARRRFDPFAPIWLFFVGYVQIYVVQAISYHDWAVRVRGTELVGAANFRAFWALGWFLLVYSFGPGKLVARLMPRPPMAWSVAPVNLLCPVLLAWGLYCARASSGTASDDPSEMSAEASFLASFAMVMLVAGSICLVTGRQESRPRPVYLAAGLGIVGLYLLLWMFNGKRSHSLVAVLVGLCSYYLPRFKRPGASILAMTAVAGVLAVGISINWRYHAFKHGNQKSAAMFLDFVTGFDPMLVLESMNIKDRDTSNVAQGLITKETEEYGCFLLMMDTVPFKADYDHGMNYLRVFSTFIPG